MKICVVCAPGGHLTQALAVLEAFEGHRVFLMTNKFDTAIGFERHGIEKTYYLKFFGFSFLQNALSVIYNSLLCVGIFLKERPALIFSTGSEITVPAFLLGKLLFGARLIYLESLTRVHTASLNARLSYWISDLFLVQWESLLERFGKKARFAGRVL